MIDRGEHVDVVGELRVVTEASVWLIRPDMYMRMPRSEKPRRPMVSEALVDNRWHRHEGVWRVSDGVGTWFRLLPAGRTDGHGVVTGLVVAMSPSAAFDDPIGNSE